MNTRILKIFALTAFVVVCIVGIRYLRDNKLGNFKSEAEIYVYPGTTKEEVFEQIDTQTVVKHPKALRKVFVRKQVDRYLTPGYYKIGRKTSSVQLARMLNNGWQTPINLTISGTLRLRDEIAEKISRQLMLSKEEMLSAFGNDTLLAKYGFDTTNVFALIVPDTYSCYWTASVEDVLNMQKKAYDAFWTEDNLQKAKNLGLSKMQVSTVASIVKGETNHEPEMPKIAGVYLNRLKKGMRLQADPTVAFCFDYSINRILLRHLTVDSPYNTYIHTGLPPGPIYVPTRACLEAVLNPDFGPGSGNIFFCASPEFDGTHRFATNLSEHNANARAFHNALDARNREKNNK